MPTRRHVVASLATLPLLSSACADLRRPGVAWPASDFTATTDNGPLDRSQIPKPVIDNEAGLVALYWEAWRQAWGRVRYQEGIPQSPYMDEAHPWEDVNWIWDTAFMVHFCKYAPHLFPGIESFDNFYAVMYDNAATSLRIHHVDNPPLFAWIEHDYMTFTGDTNRIGTVLEKKYLQQHFDFFENPPTGSKPEYGGAAISLDAVDNGFLWSGVSSGMDNSPRGEASGGDDSILWVDAIAQHGLSALYIDRLARASGNPEIAAHFRKQYDEIRSTVNSHYWDDEHQFYFDVAVDDGSFDRVWTPASYWPMLAEMCTDQQAEALRQHADNAAIFGGEHPWPTVSRSDATFENDGKYWRGGIWLPTAYMATKALEKYAFYDTADRLAYALVKKMEQTYRSFSPHTIWEAYSPTAHEPTTHKTYEKGPVKKNGIGYVTPHFCGWSALGPISMLIENVLGFHHVNALTNTVEWRRYRNDRHGIERLRFGDVVTDILYEDGTISVHSTSDYTLIVNGNDFDIREGRQSFRAG